LLLDRRYGVKTICLVELGVIRREFDRVEERGIGEVG
jgi:hypothetical protein